MSLKLYWQIDAAAEPRRAEPALRPAWNAHLTDGRSPRADRHHYYGQVARAAALTGFDGLFFPYRPEADDSQILAASVARLVPSLTLISEFPASVGSAVYAAKEAASFQRLTHERLSWAIAEDGDEQARLADGDVISREDLTTRLDEFLTVARNVHAQTGYSFKGRFFEVLNGGFEEPLNRVAFPPVFLQGLSEEQLALSARHADVHLFNPLPLQDLRTAIEELDQLAHQAGRTVAFGLKQPVTARETEEEARATGATGLVGSYDQVADALAERVRLGVNHLILGATPSLEEAYRIGEFILPRLRARLSDLRAAA